jgi:hypothetical protein
MSAVIDDINRRIDAIEDEIANLQDEYATLYRLLVIAEKEAQDAEFGRKSLAIQLGGS